jgi:hypothetical protein
VLLTDWNGPRRVAYGWLGKNILGQAQTFADSLAISGYREESSQNLTTGTKPASSRVKAAKGSIVSGQLFSATGVHTFIQSWYPPSWRTKTRLGNRMGKARRTQKLSKYPT